MGPVRALWRPSGDPLEAPDTQTVPQQKHNVEVKAGQMGAVFGFSTLKIGGGAVPSYSSDPKKSREPSPPPPSQGHGDGLPGCHLPTRFGAFALEDFRRPSAQSVSAETRGISPWK